MKLANIKQKEEEKDIATLMDCLKISKTLEFKRKVDVALKTLEDFFRITSNPEVSCGGGKDGTAIAILAKMVNPDVRIICANPPNPLPDRQKHIETLKQYLNMNWTDIYYPWEVEQVLNGDTQYPEGLKMKKLAEWEKKNNIDGVIFGIRAAESNARTINYRRYGEIYKTERGLRCQPIADWRAEDSICLALLYDAPINPVYEKMQGIGDKEQLHDGTWWPHGMADRSNWIKKYYPEHYEDYMKALRVYDGKYSRQCNY